MRGLRLRSRKRYRFFVTAGLLVLLLLVLAAFSGPGGWFVDALFPPSATITIIPKSTQESRAVSVTAVPGRPGPNQVAARFISVSSSLAVVAKSTGSEQTPALASQGTLTFYNEASSPQTVAAGTVLKGNDGVEVITDATVTVPAGNPPSVGIALTSAHAVQAGGQTNIGALDINGLCCAAGLAVKNTAPFSGGQNAQTYPVLEQQDIERAAGSVQQKLHQRAQLALEGQLSSSQQLANTPLCHATVKPVDAAGSKVSQTSVSVAVTCAGEAYDALAARHAAATLFEQKVGGQLGTAYQLISSISTGIPKASIANNQQGTLTLLVQTGATWGYHFTADEKRELARNIEGKPVTNALTSIAGMPGVEHCSIQVSGGAQTVPTDATHISIVIRPFLKGGP